MRSPSQRASSTCNTGTLDATRVSPSFRRRVASSRPRRCGIETIRGVGIPLILSLCNFTACSHGWFSKKRSERELENDGTFQAPICFQVRRQSNRCRLPGLEEIATCPLEQSFLLFLLSRCS